MQIYFYNLTFMHFHIYAFSRSFYPKYIQVIHFFGQCNKVRKEGRKRTGLAREDSGEFYLQINLNRCALCAS